MQKLRRISLWLALTCVIAALAITPAFAQESAPALTEVTTLARYFPATTPVFFSMRIDDDFLSQVSDLSERFFTLAGYDMQENLIEALDRVSADYPLGGGTYDETLGALLGDTVAVGLLDWGELFDDKSNNDYITPYLIALGIDDMQAANELIAYVVSFDDYVTESVVGFTLYRPTRETPYSESDPYVLVTNDAILFANLGESLPFADDTNSGMLLASASLASAPRFVEMQERLPEPSYSAFAYFDTTSIFDALTNSMIDVFGGSQFSQLMSAVAPTQAFGFTAMDGDVLIADLVQSSLDLAALAETGMAYAPMNAVNPAFTEHVRAGTPLVWHGSNFGGSVAQVLENLNTSLQMQIDAAQASGDSFTTNMLQEQRAAFGMMQAGVRGATGMNVEEIFGWMNGDYLFAFDFTPQFREIETPLDFPDAVPIEFAFVTAVTDADAAAASVAGLQEGITLLLNQIDDVDVTVVTVTMGGAEAVVFTIQDPSDMSEPFELMLAANDEVFVFGTIAMARHALNPDGGLNTSPDFTTASAYLVPDAAVNAYIFGDHLFEALDVVMNNMSDFERAQFNAFLLALSQAAASARINDDGSGYARFSLDLPLD